MKRTSKVFILFFSMYFFSTLKAQGFYDLWNIQRIDIYFSIPNWDYRMDTAKIGMDDYVLADRVCINGTCIDSVGVKYKGNSSYDSTYKKNPLHIELDYIKNADYKGFKDIKLGNAYSDPSMIREVLSYAILKNYMICPRANFAEVYINDEYHGIYSNAESINKDFINNHFLTNNNVFVKANPIGTAGPNTKCNLKYLGSDSTQYTAFYEMKSDYGWRDFMQLCDSVTNNPASLNQVLDMDKFLWMLAFNNILVNLDSYTGAFCQNYYLYKDLSKRYSPMVWDLNMSLGGFPFSGTGNSSLGTLDNTKLQTMPLNIHNADVYWPVIKAVNDNPAWYRKYVAHAKTIYQQFLVNDSLKKLAAKLHQLIAPSVASDNYAFFTNAQFTNALNSATPNSSITIPGIYTLVQNRKNYLASTAEFIAAAPVVDSAWYNPKSISAQQDSIVYFAKCNNASSVYLNYRYTHYAAFQSQPMLDNGTHGDAQAGDGIYSVKIGFKSRRTEYYIYAENNNAGYFLPENAAFNYNFATVNEAEPSKGELRINEIMYDNKGEDVDENGLSGDWFELYNNTNKSIMLSGCSVSDDPENPAKYYIPEAISIPANGYTVIWCDDRNTKQKYAHSNFKLSDNGDQLGIYDYFGNRLDLFSISYCESNKSWTRCPNGTGTWSNNNTSSLLSNNNRFCNVNTEQLASRSDILVYPNPSCGTLNVRWVNGDEYALEITDLFGKICRTWDVFNYSATVSVSDLPDGMYFIRCISKSGTQSVSKKIILEKK